VPAVYVLVYGRRQQPAAATAPAKEGV